MKRILFIFSALLLSVSLSAQSYSWFELSLRGGWSSLGYQVTAPSPALRVSQPGSYGYGAHFAYGLGFNKYVGLSLGVNFSRYGSVTQMQGQVFFDHVQDSEGETYNHIVQVYQLRDQQQAFYLEVPLAVCLTVPMEGVAFQAQLGAKYGLPLLANAQVQGDLEHQGDYGMWGLTLTDVAGHGFYRETNFQSQPTIQALPQVSAFVKLGFAFMLNQKTELFLNGYFSYGLLNGLNMPTSRQELGFRNDRAGQSINHNFMNDYLGVLQTPIAGAKAHPMEAGLELGIRWKLAHPKKEICHCYKW